MAVLMILGHLLMKLVIGMENRICLQKDGVNVQRSLGIGVGP